MRKDIECAFGILKNRFQIFKYGMRFQSVENCDKLFKTLCAIHNMLLKANGLNNIGNIECGEKKYEEAVRNYSEALKLKIEIFISIFI